MHIDYRCRSIFQFLFFLSCIFQISLRVAWTFLHPHLCILQDYSDVWRKKKIALDHARDYLTDLLSPRMLRGGDLSGVRKMMKNVCSAACGLWNTVEIHPVKNSWITWWIKCGLQKPGGCVWQCYLFFINCSRNNLCPLFQRTNIPHWRLMWENIATSTLVYIFKRYLVCVYFSSFLFYFCGRWQFRIFMRLRFYFCRRWPFIIFMRLPLVFIFSYLDLNVLMSWESILTVCMRFWSVSLFFDRYRADICRTRPRGSYSRSWCYSKTYWLLTLLQL